MPLEVAVVRSRREQAARKARVEGEIEDYGPPVRDDEWENPALQNNRFVGLRAYGLIGLDPMNQMNV